MRIGGTAHLLTNDPWWPGAGDRMLRVMLRLVRALAFLAPIAVAGLVLVVTGLPSHLQTVDRPLLLVAMGMAIAAGMTTMALIAWSYVGWRLNRIAGALERTLETDEPIELRIGGIPAERRLARAFNNASGAFLQVEARATHDRLTGIANRETLLATLSSEIERAVRHHKALSVAFIDIDRFKPINDTFGHNSGDAVLRQVSDLIATNVRASDVFGRYGGEEFMLILPETMPDEAFELAEKLRAIVMEATLRIADGQTLKATISLGVAGGRGDELNAEVLVDQADAAMYAAKSLGRNRTYTFRTVDESSPVRRAPVSPERRARATAIGQWASDTATQALASVLAPQAHHRGRPSDMIAALATGVALTMGLPRDEIERIRVASLLHDLGKIAIPDEILDKPASLNPDEWQAIGEHPRIGQLILEQASGLRDAIPVVLHHHERFNGSGYPHGLRGTEIPLGARIVAVADAYHAMVHDRPYKGALSHDAAVNELRTHAGLQFDPEIVEVFCAMYADGVPADGLEEVYRLHERARDGLPHVDTPDQAALHAGEARADGHGRTAARRASSHRAGGAG